MSVALITEVLFKMTTEMHQPSDISPYYLYHGISGMKHLDLLAASFIYKMVLIQFVGYLQSMN